MSVPPSVAEILTKHVTLEIEGIDRMYLNAYVPGLQYEGAAAAFFRYHRGDLVPSTVTMGKMTTAFVRRIEAFVAEHDIPVVHFRKGERKDDVARDHLSKFEADEGVLFVGKAQERASVFRTEKRRDRHGVTYPWIVRASAMVNAYYFYCVDRDFGPFFLKFCSYFPYNAKLCINGHEYLKRQLDRRRMKYEPLDNGILSCRDPKRVQQICDELTSDKIDALFRKWLRRLPHPFTRADRAAGYRYDLSILQAEFSLTQVMDRPVTGRLFFENVIRENLDIGRPDHVQIIFGRRVTKQTPGTFRTRVITEGVTPSLHVDYKRTRIKQYHKEGRALRTETTINDTRDFGIGKRLKNLPQLRKIGFQANRRLLDVQRATHDCAVGDDALRRIVQPVVVDGQRAPALRFGDTRAQALLHAIVIFSLLPRGFANRDLRKHVARLLGIDPSEITPGSMTYDLRRLRLHGLIERLPKSHRYRLTPFGLRAGLFLVKLHDRALRTGLATLDPHAPNTPLKRSFDELDRNLQRWYDDHRIAA
ncbi:MAG: hypothetical protein HZA32_05310 [Opitutae bacterium]|nr:hypothetical protein [Opitutae bacterium]